MSDTTESTAVALAPDDDWTSLYIDGERDVDGETIAVENPTTREPFAEVPRGSVDDVNEAYETAAEAQEAWAERSPAGRAEIVSKAVDVLHENREEVSQLLAVESGSSRVKAQAEFGNAAGVTSEAASFPNRMGGDYKDSNIAGKDNIVKREPMGVVGVISPWNFPLHLSIRAVAPALATGNTVVLKPASNTPITGGLLLARIFEAAGLPEGVLNVVTGKGSDIGDRMAGHPEADVVAFTGSTPVGRQVAKQAVDNLALPAMELGGNGPHVVLEDADVDQAVDAGAFGSFLHQGQICISINRHLVHESVYDEYVEKLAEKAASLPIGDPRDEETVVGPIIDESQRDEMLEYVEETVDAGATLETGGDSVVPDGVDVDDADSLFVQPTVLSEATNEMAAACNEHFGPIAPVIPFSDDEEAVELANDTEYGLAASVFSADRGRAEDVADDVDAGMVHLNDMPVNDEPHVPFGGMKASGIGRFNGEHVLEEFTQPKWVSVQREPREYPF
ncbi:aldehyde dehydrogenase (NAD+) [Halogranum rubrum]|uniref:Aldehyde dehydrogenase (NAD+) n=1 Tax=Halogranum rubrum TaxID=553466 RepID=A0A1I4GCH7_9EURY|nr:aldehyde dehydrogenase family protein [Halogranum rubrum]SFL27200.1 aldehyde dehydrogenase (NAD+) [Halogranum rubrum]